MGYLIEIDSLSCHITYAKPEPTAPDLEFAVSSEKPPLFEQPELKLEAPISAIRVRQKERGVHAASASG